MSKTPAQTVEEIVKRDFQRTPDPVPVRGSRTRGSRTKLGVMEYWFLLFERNEMAPKAEKMTNAEIARQMMNEFPDRPAIQKLAEKPSEVNTQRYLYNTGDLISYRKGRPDRISFRYNEDGDKIDAKTGRILTAAEVASHIEKYANWKPKPPDQKVPRSPRKKKRRRKTA
jgi:hypothetical protein